MLVPTGCRPSSCPARTKLRPPLGSAAWLAWLPSCTSAATRRSLVRNIMSRTPPPATTRSSALTSRAARPRTSSPPGPTSPPGYLRLPASMGGARVCSRAALDRAAGAAGAAGRESGLPGRVPYEPAYPYERYPYPPPSVRLPPVAEEASPAAGVEAAGLESLCSPPSPSPSPYGRSGSKLPRSRCLAEALAASERRKEARTRSTAPLVTSSLSAVLRAAWLLAAG